MNTDNVSANAGRIFAALCPKAFYDLGWDERKSSMIAESVKCAMAIEVRIAQLMPEWGYEAQTNPQDAPTRIGDGKGGSWEALKNADANDPAIPGWAKGENP